MYKLKSDVPEHALKLSARVSSCLLEKLLADGSIMEFEVDTEAIHTEAPGTFWISMITTNADGLDKLNAALMGASQASPINVAAFESMVDSVSHRDNLSTSPLPSPPGSACLAPSSCSRQPRSDAQGLSSRGSGPHRRFGGIWSKRRPLELSPRPVSLRAQTR